MGWAPGTQIGSYEIVSSVGYGGMGEIYKVRHVISQRIEAMKVLLSGAEKRPDLTERFIREIRVLATLNHPNIAGFHTAFHHDNQLIMVMEFVEGMNLADRFHLGLKLEQSLMCIRQVLSALEYAHSRGVVHRDLKPANIMITDSGGVKLLDFGLALVSTPDPRLTSSGSLLGSVHYISPEQIRGETLDARSDLYSLGTTLYELVTGRLPVQGDSFPEIISGHLEAKYPAPSVVNTAIPKKLSDVVMRAMARERSQRFQSAAEFASALEHAMVDSTPGWRVTMRTESVAPHSHTTHLLAPTLMPKQAKNYDAAVLEDISAQLANYIGPIAKVIVRRASSSSNNLRELCDKVAKEIDSEHSRSRFLQSVRKHLRAS